MNAKVQEAWSTRDEINAIKFIGSDKIRKKNDQPLSIEYRIARVTSWIKTSRHRVWPKDIDVRKCRTVAYGLLGEMKGEV